MKNELPILPKASNSVKSIAKVAAFACIAVLSIACETTTDRAPNVVFILVDDLGWSDLGCYGSTFYETPHIDSLAARSVLFTDAYAAASICSPSRAAILTGKYPSRLNITDWIPGHDPQDRPLLGPRDLHQLPLAEVTLAEHLRQNGYRTFFAGKWHLGGEGFFPEQQGFEENKGGHEKGSPPGGYYVPYKNPKLEDGPPQEYLTDRLTSESIDFIARQKKAPFFLFLSYYTVHTPIQACRPYHDRFREKAAKLPLGDQPVQVEEGEEGLTVINQYNAAYASMVHALDHNVGRLVAALQAHGLLENTVLIFTSDNGGLSTLYRQRKPAPTSVKPLRAGKGWLYEGGIRVPLLIKTPQMKLADHTVCPVPVIGNDFYPTVLSLVGLPPLPEQHMDGEDLSPLLSNPQGQLDREELFWHYPHYHGSAWKPGAAIRRGPWKLIEFHESGKQELYNLKNDLSEASDVLDQHPEVARSLKSQLDALQQNTNAQFARNNDR